jgi:hypothetical protein
MRPRAGTMHSRSLTRTIPIYKRTYVNIIHKHGAGAYASIRELARVIRIAKGCLWPRQPGAVGLFLKVRAFDAKSWSLDHLVFCLRRLNPNHKGDSNEPSPHRSLLFSRNAQYSGVRGPSSI